MNRREQLTRRDRRAKVPSKTMSIVQARNEFATLVNRAAFGKERLLLSRHGKPVVALVPIEDVELIERLQDEMDIADAVEARNEAARAGTKSLDELKKELKRSNVQNRNRTRRRASA
jgi:prevent-host-death family protein